jgi:hypothetical protein
MNTLYAVDRLEGELAVLVGDDDLEFTVPRRVLPLGVREGSILRVPVRDQGPDWSRAVVDEVERRRREVEARDRLSQLQRRDPGGDVKL